MQIDEAKLDKAINKYGVGSFLNVNDQALTVDKWHEMIGANSGSFDENASENSESLRH